MLYYYFRPILLIFCLLFQASAYVEPRADDLVEIKAQLAKTQWTNQAKISEMVLKLEQDHGVSREWVLDFFVDYLPDQKVIKLMDAPLDPQKKVYWNDYRKRHVTSYLISRAYSFYKQYREWLLRASTEYGVPIPIILAILGVETRYGRYLGSFNIARSLATLAFAHERRSAFYTKEFEVFMLYLWKNKLPYDQIEGSFAGALGMSQFIPSSLAAYAVDFNNDDIVDLFEPADAIGSVANFLHEHHWQSGLPVAFAVSGEHEQLIGLLDDEIIPQYTLATLRASGLQFDKLAPDVEYTLIDLHNEKQIEWRVGTINYYSLTRYNRSNKYAMAVFDLAKQINKKIPAADRSLLL